MKQQKTHKPDSNKSEKPESKQESINPDEFFYQLAILTCRAWENKKRTTANKKKDERQT
ncbi:MAG: hypothetical protein M0R38_09745 [Bacteroidia bacterium]|nr:hypothetical protein [Bacteroidia bacterium]